MTDNDNVPIYQTPEEVENFKRVIASVSVPGDIIEVGVYMGATGKLLAKQFAGRNIYLCDTYEGFPDDISVADGDSPRYKVGDMKEASLDVVKKHLSGLGVTFVKGRFPDSFNIETKFAFAHIDVDIYKATKEALQYVFPRMISGGKILIHDYPAHDGVKKAVKELGLEVKTLGGRQGLIEIR